MSFGFGLARTVGVLIAVSVLTAGCGILQKAPEPPAGAPEATKDYTYLIGPGDELSIFVWRNPDLSVQDVPVRPDGKISIPLVEDLQASGRTPSELARDVEIALAQYIRDPLVSVGVGEFKGEYYEQVRVVGQATTPSTIAYRKNMTLLDVMVAVGGLTDFAAGNKSTLVRVVDGQQQQFRVRLDDLVRDGDISANVDLMPGDVLIIPEAWF